MTQSLGVTRKLVSELEQVGIADSHVHVVAKHPDWVEQAHLHNASIFHTTNLLPALKIGSLLAALLVMVIYALFYFFLPETKITSLGILGIVGFGFMFGLWASALIGFGIKRGVVAATENAVKLGHYLVMIDVSAGRAKEVSDRILSQHADVILASDASL